MAWQSSWRRERGREAWGGAREDAGTRAPGAHDEWQRPRHRSRSREQGDSRRAAPKAKQGKRWWDHNDHDRPDGDGQSFVGKVRNQWVPVSERGRILGDRGSNVKRIVEDMCGALGHDAAIPGTGRPPFVNLGEQGGWLEFELELYPPFNDEKSFELAEQVFTRALEGMLAAPVDAESRHCKRPKKIQPDDWECPNRKCGNLCFARRKVCPICGAEKPAYKERQAPSTSGNVPDWHHDGEVSRPPKHKMKMIRTVDRLRPLYEGECQLIWLVPQSKRGAVIGPKGDTLVSLQERSQCEIHVTDKPETQMADNALHCMAIVRGVPECTRDALAMLKDAGGGRLGRDGLEPLLLAVEAALAGAADSWSSSWSERWTPLSEVSEAPDVREALARARPIMKGAGLRSLLEVLEPWPEHFGVRRTGPRGAEACLYERLPKDWRDSAAEHAEGGPGGTAPRGL